MIEWKIFSHQENLLSGQPNSFQNGLRLYETQGGRASWKLARPLRLGRYIQGLQIALVITFLFTLLLPRIGAAQATPSLELAQWEQGRHFSSSSLDGNAFIIQGRLEQSHRSSGDSFRLRGSIGAKTVIASDPSNGESPTEPPGTLDPNEMNNLFLPLVQR